MLDGRLELVDARLALLRDLADESLGALTGHLRERHAGIDEPLQKIVLSHGPRHYRFDWVTSITGRRGSSEIDERARASIVTP